MLGVRADGSTLSLSPFETTLITGSSGAGKSTIVTALLEQMRDLSFQFCVVDPEGDYSELPDAVVVGDAKQEPRMTEIKGLLAKPDVSSVVNLLAIDAGERPRFLARFLPEIAKLRAETGRPHWIVIDETHHCLPAKWDPAPITLPKQLPAAIAVTVHPEEISRDFLEAVSTVVGVGDGSLAAIAKFCRATGRDPPRPPLPTSSRIRSMSGRRAAASKSSPSPSRRKARSVTPASMPKASWGRTGASIFAGRRRRSTCAPRTFRRSCRWRPAWMTRPGCTICGPASTRGGFARPSRMTTWPRRPHAVEGDNSLSARDSRSRIKEMIDRRYTAPSKAN